MNKWMLPALGAASLLAAGAAPAQAALGPDAAACNRGSGQTAILVMVRGFQHQTGFIRVQLNGSDARTWLQHTGYLKRIELPVTAPVMPVCLHIPGPGRYAIAVRHDMNGDHHMDMHDGGGYSRNPHLSITHYRPSFDEAVFNAGPSLTTVTIVMNYLYGFSIHPVE